MSILSLQNISFSYATPAGRVPVLEDVSLEVSAADYLGVIGPNGGGKSTLLKLMLGLETPDSGQVRLFGEAPEKTRHRVGYVPQSTQMEACAPASVLDVVLMGRLSRSRFGFAFGAAHRQKAMDALKQVNLADLAARPVGALSGGQKQRVMLARALAGEAELLLLDEPTASADPRAGEELTGLLRGLHARAGKPLPIIVVSHDLTFIARDVTRVACLNRTLSVHQADAMTAAAFESAYQTQMEGLHHGDCCPVHGHAAHCGHTPNR
jgi:zinc transport system ATP-binding protein